jgi:hypothetical protein
MLSGFVKKPEQTWLLWQKCKALGQRPSVLLDVEESYPAYCLDEAVTYFGIILENMLQEAGQKPGKEERRAQMAREAVMNKVFAKTKPGEQKKTSGFADPAAMFS